MEANRSRRWPWVSREQHEYVQRQLASVDAERVRLLDIVLSGAVPERRPEIERVERSVAVEAVVDDGIRPIVEGVERGAQVAFSTPFDRLDRRFGETFGKGPIPAQYRARMN